MQKRKLSYDISSLDVRHMEAVLEIIKDSVALDTTQSEIEIDIDSLDTATLRRLRDLVQMMTAKKSDGQGSVAKPSLKPPGSSH